MALTVIRISFLLLLMAPQFNGLNYEGDVSRSVLNADVTVFFTEKEVSVKESDGSVQLTLKLSEAIECCSISMLLKFENINTTADRVNVTDYEYDPGLLTSSGLGVITDYSPVPPGYLRVIFFANDTSLSFNVSIKEDNMIDENEMFCVTIIPDSLPYNISVGVNNQTDVSIIDTTISVNFDQSTYKIYEENGTVWPVLVLSRPSSTEITVKVIDIYKDRAERGIDYNSGPYMVTFSPGSTSVRFNITISDDEIFELNEKFNLSISAALPSGVARGDCNQTTVIILDDKDLPAINFSQSIYTVDEDNGTVHFTLVLTNPTSIPVNITVKKDTPGRICWVVNLHPGNTTATQSIIITDDAMFGNMTFNLFIDVIPLLYYHVTGGHPTEAKVVIIDNDKPTVSFSKAIYSALTPPMVNLSNPSHCPVTIHVSNMDITANELNTLKGGGLHRVHFAARQTIAPLQLMNNKSSEFYYIPEILLPYGFALGHYNKIVPVVQVMFSQSTYFFNESTKQINLSLILSHSSLRDITVAVSTNISTNTEEQSFTIPAGEDIFCIEVGTIIDDNITECNETYFARIALQSLIGVSLGEPFETIMIILDNEKDNSISFNQSTYVVEENQGQIVFAVNLSNPSSTNLTVQINNENSENKSPCQTANDLTDYRFTPLNITIPAGYTTATFNVTIYEDKIVEGNETFCLFIARIFSNCSLINVDPPNAAVIIVDEVNTLKFDKSAYTVNEDNGTVTLALVLRYPSPTNFVVVLNSSNGNASALDYTPGPYYAMFNVNGTNATFSINITNDTKVEDNEIFHIFIVNVTNYSYKIKFHDPNSATVTIEDSNVNTLKFDKSAYTVDEDNGTVTFVLDLRYPSPTTFVVVLNSSDRSASALDYTPGPYYAMFNVNGTNATFSINITNDMEVEGNETFHVFITNVTDYNYNMEFLPNNVTVTIDDDDDNNCSLNFQYPQYSVNEGDDKILNLILNTALSTTVVVDLIYEESDDYYIDNDFVVFNPGQTSCSIVIRTSNDRLLEYNELEIFTFVAVPRPPAHNLIPCNANTKVAIVDNDDIAIYFTNSNYLIDNGHPSMNPGISLSNPASFIFTVRVLEEDHTAVGGRDYVPQNYSIMFNPGQTYHPLNIEAINDELVDPGKVYFLNISVSSLPERVHIYYPNSAEITIKFDQVTHFYVWNQCLVVTSPIYIDINATVIYANRVSKDITILSGHSVRSGTLPLRLAMTGTYVIAVRVYVPYNLEEYLIKYYGYLITFVYI